MELYDAGEQRVFFDLGSTPTSVRSCVPRHRCGFSSAYADGVQARIRWTAGDRAGGGAGAVTWRLLARCARKVRPRRQAERTLESGLEQSIQPVRGMATSCRPRSPTGSDSKRRGARSSRGLWLRGAARAGGRAHGALQALDRRVHRHRREGDVHLRSTRVATASRCARKRPRAWCARRSPTASRTTSACASGAMGPMFRHEKPQKGRYRQFHQIDVEALGYPGPRRRCRDHSASARACGSASVSGACASS